MLLPQMLPSGDNLGRDGKEHVQLLAILANTGREGTGRYGTGSIVANNLVMVPWSPTSPGNNFLEFL